MKPSLQNCSKSMKAECFSPRTETQPNPINGKRFGEQICERSSSKPLKASIQFPHKLQCYSAISYAKSNASSLATKYPKRRKKNHFEVAQFLPSWTKVPHGQDSLDRGLLQDHKASTRNT
ncbi:hypothetical protein CIPAW_03G224800 [Carya illinoinensis]|uniref:Uncharacterized protein n=1 Tax=Carya illinoinensis TaxID=32201 RepID=A0A8T1R4W3_CARIL|nr:hypothetical protein CIPAW_03G224800 [Carya illinoinensis]